MVNYTCGQISPDSSVHYSIISYYDTILYVPDNAPLLLASVFLNESNKVKPNDNWNETSAESAIEQDGCVHLLIE